jgi:hypothetical protein
MVRRSAEPFENIGRRITNGDGGGIVVVMPLI